MNIFESTQTEWASPMVFVPKKDGTLCFRVDYHKWNAVTTGDSYLLPRMNTYIDLLKDAKIFSTFLASGGHWQIDVRKSDREKIASTSHHGLYLFTRMRFGLLNATAAFQHVTNVISSTVERK